MAILDNLGKIKEMTTYEFLTNETFMGQPVHGKVFVIPLDSSGKKQFSHGVSLQKGGFYWIDLGNSFLAGNSSTIHYPLAYIDYNIRADVAQNVIRVFSDGDWTGWTAYVLFKYVE